MLLEVHEHSILEGVQETVGRGLGYLQDLDDNPLGVAYGRKQRDNRTFYKTGMACGVAIALEDWSKILLEDLDGLPV